MDNNQLKEGDYVTVSGQFTGYGTLTGYITDISSWSGRQFISVQYTPESSLKANGDKGCCAGSVHVSRMSTVEEFKEKTVKRPTK